VRGRTIFDGRRGAMTAATILTWGSLAWPSWAAVSSGMTGVLTSLSAVWADPRAFPTEPPGSGNTLKESSSSSLSSSGGDSSVMPRVRLNPPEPVASWDARVRPAQGEDTLNFPPLDEPTPIGDAVSDPGLESPPPPDRVVPQPPRVIPGGDDLPDLNPPEGSKEDGSDLPPRVPPGDLDRGFPPALLVPSNPSPGSGGVIPPPLDLLPSVEENGPGRRPEFLIPEVDPIPNAPLPILQPPNPFDSVRLRPRFGARLRNYFDAGTNTYTLIYEGGIEIVAPNSEGTGTVDLTADRAVIWIQPPANNDPFRGGRSFEAISKTNRIEVYAEGNVIFREDELKIDGPGDSRSARAKAAYYDFQTERFVALNGEYQLFLPGFLSPIRVLGDVVQQYRDALTVPGQEPVLGPKRIRADSTTTTGSQFATPGYRFDSGSIHLTLYDPPANPIENPGPAWAVDARNNAFFLGPVPIFYWPRFVFEDDDFDPPLRNVNFRTNNIFGIQVLTDWSVFKLIGQRRPPTILDWNLDVDYLSRRGVAVGSELTWYGRELVPGLFGNYFGYFDIWGLRESASDILGPGPAIITNPRLNADALLARRQPWPNRLDVPAFQDFRGRVLLRHMQSLLPREAGESLDDFRLQIEAAYISDRNFLEQYYKRIFDSGMDQATLAYLNYQRGNMALTGLVEGNFQDWYTETQWLPKLDYYRLGDSPLGGLLTYSGSTGVAYANIHTASEVNNRFLFPLPGGGRAFLPFDPVSNTNGAFTALRGHTTHQLDAPINLGVLRISPYAQGQLAGWTNHLRGDEIGRAWGAYGARASVTAWRAYPEVRDELFNLNGLAHKATLTANYRRAHSSQPLDSFAVMDDLDDNTYEFVRRYFLLNSYPTVLPPRELDPRLLVLRRQISPITGTTDVLDSIETVQLSLDQRLQTKRGPLEAPRIVDYMQLNLATTFFPNAQRDNFGESLGQTMYDYRWMIGDRTSIVSSGWFEFYDVTGGRLGPDGQPVTGRGLSVVTAGLDIRRDPKGSFAIGGSFFDIDTFQTSAFYATIFYWLSPKYYLTASTNYDFSNQILLGTNFALTRIGADTLVTVGLAVDPQRDNYTFGLEVAPRLSPHLQLGSGSSISRLESVIPYAPTQ